MPATIDANWPRNEIDSFILASLESKWIAPSAPADGGTLLRRLYFDLIGLPPILKAENGKLKEELLDIEIDLAEFESQPVANVRNPSAQEMDADNRLLWRSNARRLDGEATRDAMLAVSGALNRKLGGPSFRDVAVKLENNHEFTDPTGEFNDDVNRRTVYRLWARSGNNPLLESLDCPDPSVMLPRRPQTITPVQSLSLLNSRFVEQCARQLSQQIQREAGNEIEPQVVRLFQKTLGRSPQPAEVKSASDFARKRGLEQLCLVLLNTNEFLFVE